MGSGGSVGVAYLLMETVHTGQRVANFAKKRKKGKFKKRKNQHADVLYHCIKGSSQKLKYPQKWQKVTAKILQTSS